jgi:4-diphosphocytidyl-2-C-methyl-D-erythritol kinase
MKTIQIDTRAKINLTLDVLSRRMDGYHNVEMIMQSINLYDTLTITRTSSKVILESSNENIPLDDTNLACRAAKLMIEAFDIKEGVNIHLEKRIPVAAGLAGGSTNAAGVIAAIDKLYNLNASTQRLMDIGLKLGADVPYCIMGGTVLAQGIGEILTPLKPIKKTWVLLSKIDKDVSTALVYKSLDMDNLENKPDTEAALRAIETQDINLLAKSMGNVLEPVTTSLCPEITDVKNRMLREGSLGSMMSGSGPTVFGLFDNIEDGKRAYNSLKPIIHQTYLVETSQASLGF